MSNVEGTIPNTYLMMKNQKSNIPLVINGGIIIITVKINFNF
mgnify:CR=1 FL=1